MELGDAAKGILRDGSVRVRLKRAGMFQFQVFKVRRVPLAGGQFVELFLDRVIDMSELTRIANEIGLPVEAENGRAFPDGAGAKDFMGL